MWLRIRPGAIPPSNVLPHLFDRHFSILFFLCWEIRHVVLPGVDGNLAQRHTHILRPAAMLRRGSQSPEVSDMSDTHLAASRHAVSQRRTSMTRASFPRSSSPRSTVQRTFCEFHADKLYLPSEYEATCMCNLLHRLHRSIILASRSSLPSLISQRHESGVTSPIPPQVLAFHFGQLPVEISPGRLVSSLLDPVGVLCECSSNEQLAAPGDILTIACSRLSHPPRSEKGTRPLGFLAHKEQVTMSL
jgi:hypothetical protein